MANNNTVTLIGNLGRDPQTYQTSSGKEMVTLSIATTDAYRDELGNWQDKDPVWHAALAFSPKAQEYARAFRKGERVKITGSLSYQVKEALVEGELHAFREASIIISRIEDARLPRAAEQAA